jgi:hypothetical protein
LTVNLLDPIGAAELLPRPTLRDLHSIGSHIYPGLDR